MPQVMAFEGLILDVDGTLVDSNDAHALAWQQAFQHFGKSFAFDLISRHIGKGGDLLVPDLLNAREMRSFGNEVKEYRKDLFRTRYLPAVKPFPGVSDTLRRISGLGIRLALASSSDPEEVGHFTKLLGIGDLLEGVTSKKDARFSKPSPEIFTSALEKIGTDPARTLAAGDTPYDILAAHRAVLPVAAVLCGGFPREDLEKAEFIFKDINELGERIEDIERYFLS